MHHGMLGIKLGHMPIARSIAGEHAHQARFRRPAQVHQTQPPRDIPIAARIDA